MRIQGLESNSRLADALCIVIPALNEEESVAQTAQRCVEFADAAIASGRLHKVDVVVVSDGSTDRTLERAGAVTGIRTINFEQNQGYGAAIKTGWTSSDCGLLGFLDADGTCDPSVFVDLCGLIQHNRADMALGSRMGRDSKMPPVRRFGNRLYAALLGLLCGRSVTDTASGMRVIRREAVEHLGQLPNGLNFTPAMSARALLGGLRVAEFPMPYAERVGDSKLRVLKDGFRFLHAIFDALLCFRPDRAFTLGFVVCSVVALLLLLYPAEFYLQHGYVEEWMIYRFVGSLLMSGLAGLSLTATAISHRLTLLGAQARTTDSFWSQLVSRAFTGGGGLMIALSALISATWILWPGIKEFAIAGTCSLHWTRLLCGAFLILSAGLSMTTTLLLRIIDLLAGESVRAANVVSHQAVILPFDLVRRSVA